MDPTWAFIDVSKPVTGKPVLVPPQGWDQSATSGAAPVGNVDTKLVETRDSLKTRLKDLSSQAIRASYPLEGLGSAGFINRAAVKMANMDAVFNFTDYRQKSTEQLQKQKFTYADVAGAPGSWSQYVRYRRPNSQGYGISLLQGGLPWDASLKVDGNTFQQFDKYGGDIILAWRDFVQYVRIKNTAGIDLVMCDGGIDVESEEKFKQQELLNFPLIFHECLTLNALKQGGSFVCKCYDTHTDLMADLIYVLEFCFPPGKLLVFKPSYSRSANAEQYIVGTDFQADKAKSVLDFLAGISDSILARIPVDNKDKSTIIANSLMAMKNLVSPAPPASFKAWLYEHNNTQVEQQILALQVVFDPQAKRPKYHTKKALLLWDLESDEPRDIRDQFATSKRAGATKAMKSLVSNMSRSFAKTNVDLARGLQEQQTTRALVEYLRSAVNQSLKDSKKAEKALERWLLSMANDKVKPLVSWSPIYKLSALDSEVNQQFIRELVNDKLVSDISGAQEVVKRLQDLIRTSLSNDPPTAVGLSLESLKTISQTSFLNPNRERIILLTRLGGEHAVIKLILRYDSLIVGGQQWSLPRAHFKYLYDEFGVRNEAFASPLNSKMLDFKDGSFYSLFPDTDTVFGSKGNFFDHQLATPGNPSLMGAMSGAAWEVNPPFMESSLTQAARKVLNGLQEAKDNNSMLSFFFASPAWTDAEFYRLLSTSPFKRFETRLEKGKHFYELPSGEMLTAKADSFYFILTSLEPSQEFKDKIPGMLQTLAKTDGKVWRTVTKLNEPRIVTAQINLDARIVAKATGGRLVLATDLKEQGIEAKKQIFIGRTDDNFKATKSYVLVEPETSTQQGVTYLYKTHYDEQRVDGSGIYVSFTALPNENKTMVVNNLWLYYADRNFDAVVTAWLGLSNKPILLIIGPAGASWDALKPEKDQKFDDLDGLERVDNIYLIRQELDDKVLDKLSSQSQVQIITSGLNNINRARRDGKLILSLNVTGLNEVLRDNSAVLAPSVGNLGEAITHIQGLSNEQVKTIGNKAKELFDRDTEIFLSAIKKL